MNVVAEWLESDEGLEWSQSHFSMDASDCHDMIEVIDDYTEDAMDDHCSDSTKRVFDYLREDEPVWHDLTWTPDQDPTRVLHMFPMQGHRDHLERETAGQMPKMSSQQEERNAMSMCQSYCTHGGRCTLDRGHDGLHDSSYCTWADADGLTKEAADAVLSQTERGRDYLETFDPLASFFEAMISDDE